MSDAGVRADLEFDVTQALADIDRLERELNQATTSFATGLANAVRNLNIDVPPVQVDVEADTGDVRELQQGLADTEAAADGAEREIDQVEQATTRAGRAGQRLRDEWKSIAPVIGAAAILGGLRAAVDAASDLEESGSKAAQVFGDAVGEVQRFAETSATSVGLARQEFLEFAGTFGNLFVSMGLAQDAAADLAPEIVQLGADLASFNNLGVDETLEKIRSGLVGEIEPLRALGINFNAAQVEAKAMALGLADANGELTEGAKLQARWALITEQSATAAGDFARTSDGLANQQRILKAELRDAAAEIGQQLLPVALDLARVARDDLIPLFTDLATDLVPLLGSAFSAATPLAAGALDVLAALTPILSTLAGVIDSIPEPLLTMAGAWFAVNRAVGPLPRLLGGARGGMVGLLDVVNGLGTGALTAGGGIGTMTARIRTMNLVARGAALGGLAVLALALNEINQEAEEAERRGREQGDFVRETAAGSAEAAEGLDALRRRAAALRREIAETETDPISGFLARTIGGGKDARRELEQLEAAIAEVGAREIHLDENLNIVANQLGITRDRAKELAEVLGVDLTQAGGATNLLAVARDAGGAEAALRGSANATDAMRAALEQTRQPAEGVGIAYERLGFGADRVIEAFEVGSDRAATFAQLIRDTGLSMEELLAIEADVEASIASLAQQFESQVPRIAGAFSDLPADGPRGLNDFLQAAEQRLADTAEFQDNIAALLAAGADDLARAFLAAGPEAAAQAAREAARIDRDELMRKERHFEDQKRREDLRLLQLRDFARRTNTTMSQIQLDEHLAAEHQRALAEVGKIREDLGREFDALAQRIGISTEKLGEELYMGIVRGLSRTQALLLAEANAGVDNTVAMLQAGFKVASPSRVTEEIGRQVVLGLAEGLRKVEPALSAARELSEMTVGAFDPGGSARPPTVVPGAGVGAPAVAAASVASPHVIERERDTIQIGPIISPDPVQTAIETYQEQRAAQFRQGRGG